MAHRPTSLAAALLAALTLGFAATAAAAPTTWAIDRAHSNVSFSIRHFFTKVSGSFNQFSGTIVYDPENVAATTVQAEIDAASIDTRNEKRDQHLRTADFFDVEKYPKITFASTKVTPAGDKVKIDGNLTMHGVTKPVTLEGSFLGSGPAGKAMKAGFEATTKVDRKDFGIVWNRALDQGGAMLGDDVEIRIAIEAGSGEAKPAEAKVSEGKK